MPRIFIWVCALLLAALPVANGQSVTGRISGTVTDETGAVVPGATIRLTSDLTTQGSAVTTDSNGSFVFADLVPGYYSVHIAQPGFKGYDQKGINVGAQQRVDLHDIKLGVGDVSTSVEVEAAAARVATDSSDRAVQIPRAIIESTEVKGRDYLGLLRVLPGAQATDTNDKPGFKMSGAAINGGAGVLPIVLDGVVSQDSGGLGTTAYLAPSIDAIGEVRIMVANYNAEYGSRAGGQLNVFFKNGTSQFHGSAYFFWRHEGLDANEWFNNKVSAAIPLYRYQDAGGTIGGPLIIPGTRFNKGRTKLFFFFSEEYLHSTVTQPNLPSGAPSLNQYNMPTAAERSGDFSQTLTSTGVLIPIKDPTTGAPYPGNRMPLSQLNPIGVAMMNLFPLPFTSDPTGLRQYNAFYQFARPNSQEDRVLRLDYNLGSKTVSYLRLLQHYQTDRGQGAYGLSALGSYYTSLNGGWGQFATNWDIPSAGFSLPVVRTIRPNLINETTFGINRAHQIASALNPASAAALNNLPLAGANGQPFSLASFYPSNILNLRPDVSFAAISAQSPGQAVTNPPFFGFTNRWPFNGTDQLTSVTNNVTWVTGRHSVKVGAYFERVARNVSVYETYNTEGIYFFGTDGANPNDTGYPYSNLLYGDVQGYGQDNKRQVNHARYSQFEWFAQDTWKVGRRVTLDLGVRFQLMQPTYSVGATLGLFSGSAYSPSKSGQLLFPAMVNGQKVAINPQTGKTYPAGRIGLFDPASYPSAGDPYSGMVQYNSKFFHTPPPQIGPRAGFAWDVFGNGKMAIRGGFGIFYDRAYGVDVIGAASAGIGPMAAPPAFQSAVVFNTTFSSLLSAQNFYAPQNVDAGSQNLKQPTIYQWSFGVQRDVGSGIIVEAAFVGNVLHHGFGTLYNAAAIPPGTTWTPQGGPNPKYFDPTSSGGGTGGFYNVNLITSMVAYPYASIPSFTSKGASHYDSLQVQVNRHFGTRLQFAANWTWSKNITYSPAQWVNDSITRNVSGRPQAVNATFGWQLPSGSRIWRNFLTKGVLDGWHLNGVVSLFAGTPMTINCTVVSAPIGWPTGIPSNTGIPQRCQMVGPLWLPAGATPPSTTESRLWYPFNSASFVLPPATTRGLGTTPPTLTYGPGFENFDLSIFKEFRIMEGRSLEFRAEAFNAFNHFNPSNPNTTLNINYASGVNTNSTFGVITTAQNLSRRGVLSLKFRF